MTDYEPKFPSRDEIDAWEMRVMSLGHGVLSDSEWRRLIDSHNAMREALHRLVSAVGKLSPTAAASYDQPELFEAWAAAAKVVNRGN